MKSNVNEIRLLEQIESETAAENVRHENEIQKIKTRYLEQRDYFRQELAPKTEAEIENEQQERLRRLEGFAGTVDGISIKFIATSLQNCLPLEFDMRIYQLKYCPNCDGNNPICNKTQYFFVNVYGRYVTIAQRPCRKSQKIKKHLTTGLRL